MSVTKVLNFNYSGWSAKNDSIYFPVGSKIHNRRGRRGRFRYRWPIIHKSRRGFASNWRRYFQAVVHHWTQTADFPFHAVHGQDSESRVGLKIDDTKMFF